MKRDTRMTAMRSSRDQPAQPNSQPLKAWFLVDTDAWSGSTSYPADWPDEGTDDPLYADRRNFNKVEKSSRDGQWVTEMLFAGKSLAKAQLIFERFIQKRRGRG
jgi:hypothetical protein